MPSFIPDSVLRLLFGTPFGSVFPSRTPPQFPAIDCRTAALRVLRLYFTNLTFYRQGAALGGRPVPFQVKEENFIIDSAPYEHDLVTPSAFVIPGRGDYGVLGLGSYIEEDTADLFGKGTALQWQSEYTEVFQLELWCSSPAERHALLAGIDVAFSPTEQMSGVRFKVPEYFDELVCFILNSRTLLDDAEAGRHRWRARVELDMRINVVSLVNYSTLQPVVTVAADVEPDGAEVVISPPNDPQAVLPDSPDGGAP